ncbi:MAG: hypothetical protein IKJ25_02625 [Clostridia bacterium]|nr:hypothetical protein [Clostridia bacterium]
MATFYNQATLSFAGRVTNSNVTEGELVSGLSLTKTAVSTDYGPGDGIVYAVTLVNADSVAKSGITLTDNLGAYTLMGGTTEFVPLTYVDGSVLYYQNGVLQPAPTVVAGNTLVISGIDVPAGGNVIVLYEVRANSFAPLSAGSSIFNTVSAGGDGVCEELTDNAQIPTRDEPLLSIAKAVNPLTLTCGDEVTYTFIIQNAGNTAVVATDDLIVSDTFNPILTSITVTLNGELLNEGTQYTYNEQTGEFTTIGGAIPVPTATFTRDSETGVVTTTPGVAVLTITGMI